MHHPYEHRLKHKADFRVKYKFRTLENGGRKQPPFQGIRSDFLYLDFPETGTHIIFPEFEDADGIIILNNQIPVPADGTAQMWIVNPARRHIHREIIKIGVKCFFREGTITADCEVIEILDLFKNPIA